MLMLLVGTSWRKLSEFRKGGCFRNKIGWGQYFVEPFAIGIDVTYIEVFTSFSES
jgi:hypothetical protein